MGREMPASILVDHKELHGLWPMPDLLSHDDRAALYAVRDALAHDALAPRLSGKRQKPRRSNLR